MMLRGYDPSAWQNAENVTGNSSDLTFVQPSDLEQANANALNQRVADIVQQSAQKQVAKQQADQQAAAAASSGFPSAPTGTGTLGVMSNSPKNWGGFATDLVKAMGGDPTNRDLVGAMLTWFVNEQPPDRPRAKNNPLNIQAGKFMDDLMDGVTANASADGAHQYNFKDWASGIEAYRRFLNQHYYTGIVSAIRQGNARGLLQAIQDSPWAANHYDGGLVGQYGSWNRNWERLWNGRVLT